MLAEMIIYIALFAALFSGAFSVAFQTMDSIRYLQNKKYIVDDFHFLSFQLDSIIKSSSDWQKLNFKVENGSVIYDGKPISGKSLFVDSVEMQIVESVTSSNRALFLNVDINKKVYKFSYVQEK